MLNNASIAVVLREEDPYRRKYPTEYGKTQIVPAQFSPWMDFDFLIILNEDEWIELNDAQCLAVLDHQLSFCTLNQSGAWALAKPDVVEFSEVIRRNGWWSRELDRAEQAQKSYMQQRLPGTDDTRITFSAGGRVATITGDQLDKLNDSLAV